MRTVARGCRVRDCQHFRSAQICLAGSRWRRRGCVMPLLWIAPGEQPKHVAVAFERLKHVLDAELKAVAIRNCLQSVHALRVRGCCRVEIAVLLHHHRQSRDEGILRVEGAIPQCLLLRIPKIAHRMSGLHKHLPCTPACAGSGSRPSTCSPKPLASTATSHPEDSTKTHQRRSGGPRRKDDLPRRVPPRCHPPHARHPLSWRHAPAEPASEHHYAAIPRSPDRKHPPWKMQTSFADFL